MKLITAKMIAGNDHSYLNEYVKEEIKYPLSGKKNIAKRNTAKVFIALNLNLNALPHGSQYFQVA